MDQGIAVQIRQRPMGLRLPLAYTRASGKLHKRCYTTDMSVEHRSPLTDAVEEEAYRLHELRESLNNQKLDASAQIACHRHVESGGKPLDIYISFLALLTTSQAAEKPGELCRIREVAAIRVPLSKIPQLLADPEITYLEHSRQVGSL